MQDRYIVFTRMPGESYPRRLRSLLLCLCDVFRTLNPCASFKRLSNPCVLIMQDRPQFSSSSVTFLIG